MGREFVVRPFLDGPDLYASDSSDQSGVGINSGQDLDCFGPFDGRDALFVVVLDVVHGPADGIGLRPASFPTLSRAPTACGDSLETRLDQHLAAIDAAAEAGVRHVVYTSAVAPRPDTNPLPNSHYWTEQALASSRIPDWTILRNSIYAEMILMGLPQAVASGQLFAATDGRGRSYVTREDCAHVAAAAPTSDFDGKRTLDVTGPTPVTQDELAAIAGKLAGRRVDHVELQAKDLRNGMVASGLPDIYADVLVALDVDAAHGYHAVATPVVEQLNRRISQPQRGHGGACLPRRPLERRKGDLTSLHACVSKSRKRLGTARRTAFIDWR